ncbi:MAG: ABC transporter permease [Gemmatimonadota bacterium]|nr:MAG: ABC transporter permease [Gemmatimonadota bacterium]
MQEWLSDLRVGFRVMRRSPGITGVAILTIALGIGATTAIFSLVNGILLRPLPYPDAHRLVTIWNTLPGAGIDVFAQSAALHFTYEDQSSTLEAIGLWTAGGATVTGIGDARRDWGIWTTHGTLEALGAQPVMGRRFTAADDTPGAPGTVMLSHGYWQGVLGGRLDVIGQTLQVDGETCEIIGVMPEGRFVYDLDPALYLPLRIDRSAIVAGQFRYRSLARLAPGATVEQAKADMTRLLPVHIEAFPGGMTLRDMREAKLAPIVRPLKEQVLGNIGPRLWVFFGAAGLVLLIAVANVANLVLVQAEARDREIAVRTAIGASRGRVARQFLIESTGLAVLGGLLGIGLAYAGLEVIRATSPGGLPRLYQVSIDPLVLLFTLGLSLLTGIVFGLFPVTRCQSHELVSALKEGGGRAGTGRPRNRVRNSLAVVQIAVSLVLLVGSGLMVRSFLELHKVDPGFGNPGTVLTLQIGISSGEVPDLEEMVRTHEFIAERLLDLPGVSSVGLTSKLPLSGGVHVNPVWVEGFLYSEGTPAPAMQYTWVGGDYFETMRIPLLAGRYLTRSDARDKVPVVAVSESLALQYWQSPAEAIGKRISGGRAPGEGGWREIVGVVGDIRDNGITQEAPPITYWPLVTPNPWQAIDGVALIAPRHVRYAIRAERAGTPGFLREVRETIASVNPNLPAQSVQMLNEILSRGTARTSFMLAMLGIAAGVAFVLAIVGAYGVVSYIASQRTRELGVRMAVGAHPAAVVRLVLKHGLVLSASGLGLGLVAAYWMSHLLEAFLFGVDPVDPTTFAIAALSLVVATLLACLLPAQRAARIDPIRALRSA